MKKFALIFFVSIFALQCSKNEKSNLNVTENSIVKNENTLPKDSLKKYAEQTKKLLVSNLTQKIAENGTENALEFCNVNAIPLTEKLNKEKNVTIKRVSDQPRNQNNAANAEELKIITAWKNLLENKQELKPVFQDGTLYAPIVTNAMCMQCHGVPEKDIKPNVLAKINQLYPLDRAINYGENHLRGALVVSSK